MGTVGMGWGGKCVRSKVGCGCGKSGCLCLWLCCRQVSVLFQRGIEVVLLFRRGIKVVL